MKIDKIKKLPNGKYKITFDDNENLITYDDVLIKNKLLFDKEVNKTKYEEISSDTKYYDVYNKIIKMISKRIRSKKEIEEYLETVSIDDNDKLEIIKKLEEIGFINDLAFTKAFTYDKFNLSNYGPYKIKNELLKHSIEESLIDESINSILESDIVDKLQSIINKRIKNNNKYSNYILKQKTVLDLVNLGYDKEMIADIYDSNKLESNYIIEKEFNKQYNKLVKKYKDNELKYKLREKLYQKGFDIESINNLLQKKELN